MASESTDLNRDHSEVRWSDTWYVDRDRTISSQFIPHEIGFRAGLEEARRLRLEGGGGGPVWKRPWRLVVKNLPGNAHLGRRAVLATLYGHDPRLDRTVFRECPVVVRPGAGPDEVVLDMDLRLIGTPLRRLGVHLQVLHKG